MNAVLFLSGYRRISTDRENAAALLNLCFVEGIPYAGFANESDGGISFCVSLSMAKRLFSLCERKGIAVTLSHGEGLPCLLWRYRRRAGLMLGALIAVILLVISQRFVWDVRVKGNEMMSESEILAELRACGFGVGSYIPDLNTPALENRILITSDRISWISIHMEGTVAVVQVIEHKPPVPAETDTKKPANLIAACDGQIEYLQLYRGAPVVVVGQAVKKGELLVSGIYDSALDGYRYTRAAGMVMARTKHTVTVEIPLSYEEKVSAAPETDEMWLYFFDFSLKFYKSTGNEGGSCDIIKEDKELNFWGLHDLPISIGIVRRVPYEMQTAERTYEEALELAYAELDARLTALCEDAEILEKRVTTTLTDGSVILECTVSCLENIALQQDFEIAEVS